MDLRRTVLVAEQGRAAYGVQPSLKATLWGSGGMTGFFGPVTTRPFFIPPIKRQRPAEISSFSARLKFRQHIILMLEEERENPADRSGAVLHRGYPCLPVSLRRRSQASASSFRRSSLRS